jgi:CheY-like chemotaxis protein
MRILLVENEITSIDTFNEELELAGIAADVSIARSRDSALSLLAESEFDVVLCDLRIPSTDGALDEEDEHGILVLREATTLQQVAPVLVLSGFGTLDNIGELVNKPERNIYGTVERVAMVRHTPKKNYALCIAELRSIAAELDGLASVQIEGGDDLGEADARALRVYARPRGGALVKIDAVSPGLSRAIPLRVTVYGSDGGLTSTAFAKLDSRAGNDSEELRYQRYVNGVLPAGSFASVAENVTSSGGRSALVYSLIAGQPRSLFALLRTDQAAAVEVVRQLRRLEEDYWIAGAPSELVAVRDIRESRGGRDDLLIRHLAGIDWPWLEQQTLDVRRATQHGDMHGENVMIDDDHRPFVIDFAQTGPAAVSLDPVVLELSLTFHEKGRAAVSSEPNVDALATWPDAEAFARSGPFPDFVRAARDWAESNGAGRRPVLANAYGHAVRQLAYEDINPDWVRAVVTGVIGAWPTGPE